MRRYLRPAKRTRRWLAVLAVLSLLFQQVALASYVCSPDDMRMMSVGMPAHCDGMPMAHGQQLPALCPAHCANRMLATQDAHSPTVPPLSMPALPPAPIVPTASLPTASAAHGHAAAWRLSGIPPALRFRVLLI